MDTVARFGGEEFAMILPNCAPSFAQAVAERIRLRVQAQTIAIAAGVDVHVTVSIGGAFAPQWVRSSALLWVERADQQLYRAKSEGRNRACLEQPTALAREPRGEGPPLRHLAVPGARMSTRRRGRASSPSPAARAASARPSSRPISPRRWPSAASACSCSTPTSAWPTSTSCSTCIPKLTLHDVFTGKATLDEAILAAPGGFSVLLAGSGLVEYSRLTPQVREQLIEIIEQVAPRFDRILLDTGAGISDVVLHAISLADDVLVVATPEPTSMTDAYATIKVLATLQKRRRIRLVVNQVSVAGEGRTIRNQLQLVIDRFVAPHLAVDGDGEPLVARAARRDRQRPGGSRGGAEAQPAPDHAAGLARGAGRQRHRRAHGGLSGRAQRVSPRRPQQHDHGAMAAIGGARVGEGQHRVVLHQPGLHLRLQHGFAPGRAMPLAVHDAHAAPPGARRIAKKLERRARALRRGAARAGRARPAAPRRRGGACAPRRCRCRGGETTARRRCRAGVSASNSSEIDSTSTAFSSRSRWRACGGGRGRAGGAAAPLRSGATVPTVAAKRDGSALRAPRRSGGGLRGAALLGERGADGPQIVEVAHSKPRSANETTAPWPTTRWSSTRTSTSASALFKVWVRYSSAREGSAAPDGWLWARITAAACSVERALDDLARVDAGLRQGAAEHFLEDDEAALRIEKENREHLVAARAELQGEIVLHLARRIEDRPDRQLAGHRAARQLEHRGHLGALGRAAEALDALQLLGAGAQQPGKAADTRERNPLLVFKTSALNHSAILPS